MTFGFGVNDPAPRLMALKAGRRTSTKARLPWTGEVPAPEPSYLMNLDDRT